MLRPNVPLGVREHAKIPPWANGLGFSGLGCEEGYMDSGLGFRLQGLGFMRPGAEKQLE